MLRPAVLILIVVWLHLTACAPPPEPIGDAAEPDFDYPAQLDSQPQANARGLTGLLPVPAGKAPDDPLVLLGKRLFHDTRLSRDDSISCASCHVIRSGGDDGRPVSVGVAGQVGDLNAPTVLNSSLNFAQFWDGRAADLTEQVPGPIHNPVEMDSDWSAVLPKLKADPQLVQDFADAGLGAIDEHSVVRAIVAYQEALVTAGAPFDRYLQGDDTAISEQARTGADMFVSYGCVSCHQGRNVGGNMFQRFGVLDDYFDNPYDIREADLGRFNVTGRERDRFVFKVPALRNVTETAPYFHNGSVATLEEAVGVMGRIQLGRELSEEERSALVAFLETLTGDVDEGLL